MENQNVDVMIQEIEKIVKPNLLFTVLCSLACLSPVLLVYTLLLHKLYDQMALGIAFALTAMVLLTLTWVLFFTQKKQAKQKMMQLQAMLEQPQPLDDLMQQ